MRGKWGLIGAVSGALVIAFAPLGAAQDRNCDDFDSWREAQDFFEAEGGPENDPHGLDGDSDGIACEDFPGAPETLAEAEPEAAPVEEGKTPSDDTPAATTQRDDLPTTGLPVWLYGMIGLNVLQVGWGLLLIEDRARRGPRAKRGRRRRPRGQPIYWQQH